MSRVEGTTTHLVMNGMQDLFGVQVHALGYKFSGVGAQVGRQLLPAVARPNVPHRARAPVAGHTQTLLHHPRMAQWQELPFLAMAILMYV